MWTPARPPWTGGLFSNDRALGGNGGALNVQQRAQHRRYALHHQLGHPIGRRRAPVEQRVAGHHLGRPVRAQRRHGAGRRPVVARQRHGHWLRARQQHGDHQRRQHGRRRSVLGRGMRLRGFHDGPGQPGTLPELHDGAGRRAGVQQRDSRRYPRLQLHRELCLVRRRSVERQHQSVGAGFGVHRKQRRLRGRARRAQRQHPDQPVPVQLRRESGRGPLGRHGPVNRTVPLRIQLRRRRWRRHPQRRRHASRKRGIHRQHRFLGRLRAPTGESRRPGRYLTLPSPCPVLPAARGSW